MIDVLLDMTALNTGSRERGIGRYVRNLCVALAARSSWLAQYPDLESAALNVVGLVRHHGATEGALDPSLLFAGDRGVPTINYQRHKLERRLFLGGLARRTGARLLHLSDPFGTPLDRRLPRIVTCHDLIPLMLGKSYLAPVPWARSLQRARDIARYKTAARVIAISEATRRDLIEQLGLRPERVDVVHQGVDHERFTPDETPNERARLTEKFGIRGPYLLFIGAGDTRKNLPCLVRAFARSGLSKDLELVLAGPISPRRGRELAELVAKSKLDGRVLLLGYVEDDLAVALYRQCLGHVFPSSYEGFGLPVLEAMACGAPTLTTSLSALGEVAGDAALTIDSADELTLASALERLVSDSELRTLLRERGLRRAQMFTWQRCAAETLRSYQRALNQGQD